MFPLSDRIEVDVNGMGEISLTKNEEGGDIILTIIDTEGTQVEVSLDNLQADTLSEKLVKMINDDEE